MGQKTYNKFVSDNSNLDTEQSESSDQTNPEPFKPWTGFSSFYHELCRKVGCNPKWQPMVENHIRKLGWLEDQTKWVDGCKNFGIKF